ncbi:MAG: transporter, partial [Tepidisphaeraceae bacterium]
VMPSNLKVGLLNNVDLQFVIDPYVNVRTKADDAGSDRVDGFGNIQLRLKINLWGNEDGSPTAMALMPFVQFPTADDEFGETDHVTGGLIVPFKAELPAGFSLGLMGEIDIVRDDEDDDYAVELMHTAILGHDIVGDLAGYVEYIGIAPVDTGGGYQALASAGLTYGLGENAQLDGGVVVGISDSAEDVRFFVGLSVRH